MDFDFWPFNRITTKDRSFIARQLAVMIGAGLPLTQVFQSLSNQARNRQIKAALRQILSDLENGYRLADALKKHPRLFSSVYVSVTAAGEATGKLALTTQMLANDLERDQATLSRMVGALIYPGFIVGAMVAVAIIMVTRIVPALEQVFQQSNMTLPWTTRMVIWATNSLLKYWPLYLLALAGLITLATSYWRSEDGRRRLDSLLLKIPVVGLVMRNLEMERFNRILGMMISSGVPIIQAIEAVAGVLDNATYRDVMVALARNVERGATLSQTLAKYKEVPSQVTEMIAVGEQTGRLDEMLGRLAVHYREEVDQGVKNITSLLEPIIFVIVGLGVAFLVVSIIVPIYGLAGAI